MKKSGVVIPTISKDSGIAPPTKWYSDSKRLVIKNTNASSRGILKQRKRKCTIHFNGDSFKTELLFQTVHSVNQLSVCGAVASCCHQFALTEEGKGQVGIVVDNNFLTMVEPEKVELSVSLPTQASGNRMQGGALGFQTLEKKIQHTQLCEKAFFQHLVIAGNYYKIDRMQPTDGGRVTLLCREYSSSRSYPKTKALSAVPHHHSTSFGSSRCKNS